MFRLRDLRKESFQMAKKHEYKRREPKPKVLVYNKTGFEDGCQAQGKHILIPASNPAMKIIGNVEVPGDLAESMCKQMPETFTMNRAEAFSAMGMVDAVTATKVEFLDGMNDQELIGALKFSGYDGDADQLGKLPSKKLKELAESWAKGLRAYPEASEEVVEEKPEPMPSGVGTAHSDEPEVKEEPIVEKKPAKKASKTKVSEDSK